MSEVEQNGDPTPSAIGTSPLGRLLRRAGRDIDFQNPLVRIVASGAVGLLVFLVLMLFGPLSGPFIRPLVSGFLGIATMILIFSAPRLLRGQRGNRIAQSLPYFITQFGVLATTDMDRVEMLRILATDPEHPDVANEMMRIHRLTTEWGLSLADAVRAVAQNTPSPVFEQFLLRLAHATESGQSLEGFLTSEQAVVMQDYTSYYDAQLMKVENWKETFNSTMTSIGFLAVFAAVIPILAGGDILTLMLGIGLVSAFLVCMLGILLRERIPADRLTPTRRIQTREEIVLRAATLAGAVAATGLFFIVTWYRGLPVGIVVGSLPLLIPGILALRSERRIRCREADFPAFVRSLGAAAAARGGGIRQVLGHVQSNNLGVLSSQVRALHRRLIWRIDDGRSWSRFGAETGSRLIDRFSDMFVNGTRSGGKSGVISQIISDNMVHILGLRTGRKATSGAFLGLLIGLTAGLSLVLFIGVGVFGILTNMFGDSADLISSMGILNISTSPPTAVINDIMFGVITINGFASGFYFKMVEGGRMTAALPWCVLLVCIGVVIGSAVATGLPKMIG